MISRSLAAVVLITVLVGCTKREFLQASSSMEPTIKRGEVITVDLKAYSGATPVRWDVVVFESPLAGSGHLASRVVGLPGETVNIRSGKVVIDGKEQKLPPHLSIGSYKLPNSDLTLSAAKPVTLPFKIPVNAYFVLGDNISNALDSRYWGSLDGPKILGKVPGK
jgi:signal peptidase I